MALSSELELCSDSSMAGLRHEWFWWWLFNEMLIVAGVFRYGRGANSTEAVTKRGNVRILYKDWMILLQYIYIYRASVSQIGSQLMFAAIFTD